MGIYQWGIFEAFHWSPLGPHTAMFWMSPCVAFSIVVGLGLDYDVFYTEAFQECLEDGVPVGHAVSAAMAKTGTVISAAGVIMIVAFSALLFGPTPLLNEISVLL